MTTSSEPDAFENQPKDDRIILDISMDGAVNQFFSMSYFQNNTFTTLRTSFDAPTNRAWDIVVSAQTPQGDYVRLDQIEFPSRETTLEQRLSNERVQDWFRRSVNLGTRTAMWRINIAAFAEGSPEGFADFTVTA